MNMRAVFLFGAVILASLGVAALTAPAMDHPGVTTSAPAATQASQPTTAPAKFVNFKCPIEGGLIVPDKVPANLIREYKGQKVAFCCAMCPPVWDKLSDAEKDAKLKPVLIK